MHGKMLGVSVAFKRHVRCRANLLKTVMKLDLLNFKICTSHSAVICQLYIAEGQGQTPRLLSIGFLDFFGICEYFLFPHSGCLFVCLLWKDAVLYKVYPKSLNVPGDCYFIRNFTKYVHISKIFRDQFFGFYGEAVFGRSRRFLENVLVLKFCFYYSSLKPQLPQLFLHFVLTNARI